MRQKAFWMKLHAEHWKFAMGNSHDLAVTARLLGPSGDFEFLGQCFRLNHQAMIARRLKWVFKSGKQSAAIVVNHVRFAVHEILGANNGSAECLAHRLMT